MKRDKDTGGLFRLLAGQFLLFTLTLALLAAGVFCIWDAALMDLYRPADWDALLADEAMREGRYESLKNHLRSSGDFAVYAPDGTLTYASADDFDAALTAGEIACVRPREEASGVEAYVQTDANGAARVLVLRRIYAEDGSESVRAMALDAEYRVVWGGLGDGRTAYTPREYAFLTDTRFDGGQLSRASFTGADGVTYTVLLRDRQLDDAESLRLYGETRRIWLLFLPLCLADAGIFIWWLRRRIARPLRRLNDAVTAQAQGRSARVGDCGGPREIRRIGESFDRFSAQLEASEAERRRLDEGRQKLIADISHDLKTPLTVICGSIDAVCDGKVPPEEIGRTLRVIRKKARTLAELVDTFHEYSKTQHPAFSIQPRRTDACEFLREYLAARYDEIDLAGFSLEVEFPETPVFCMADPAAMRRVLDNLLSNALRHNRLGTILFAGVCTANGRVEIRIADNGEGIPPDRRARIFEPFVTGSDARSSSGSGLGLSIARRIVEKHGGTIALAARPAPGRTTEFVISLPAAPD